MIDTNEINHNSRGGTELMIERLNRLPPQLHEDIQIIPSRLRKLDETKYRIFWAHDLPGDPESKHLEKSGWQKFHKLVFVSNWQRDAYINHYKIPYSKTTVIHNGIDPIPSIDINKSVETIKIIYHTTPHRGLQLLVPVFEELCNIYDNIELDVYSSFKIYGWEDRDKEFAKLFDDIKQHPKMHYHGTVSNNDVRNALARSHIFAYPSIWPETSCLSLMEAMSAKCMIVHPSYGALPETSANWTVMYDMHEDTSKHMELLYANLNAAIQSYHTVPNLLSSQKDYCDIFYNWNEIQHKWIGLFESIRKMPLEIEPPKEYFVYRT